MKTYLVTSAFCLGRGRDVFEGNLIRVPEDITEEALLRIARERVKEIIESAPEPDLPSGEGASAGTRIHTRDPRAQHRDPRS